MTRELGAPSFEQRDPCCGLEVTAEHELQREGALVVGRVVGEEELVELHERIALPARRAKVLCVALNTSELEDEDTARRFLGLAKDADGDAGP
jgi:hypothetical protein